MSLTTSQLQAIKADIAANSDLNTVPAGPDGAFEIARLYNLPPAVPMSVWRTDAPVDAIFDAITWANYTPNDAADNTVAYTNRGLNIQTKQMNLQNMTIGRTSLNASRPNVRGGLRDAVIQVPSGAGGAAQNPGGNSGATVLAACVRPASRIEKLLVNAAITSGANNDTTGTTAARVMGFEGAISYQDIVAARDS